MECKRLVDMGEQGDVECVVDLALAALSPAPAHPDEGLRAACEALMKYEKAMDGADGCGENDDLYWEAVRLAIAALSPAPAKPPASDAGSTGGIVTLVASGDSTNPPAPQTATVHQPKIEFCSECGTALGVEEVRDE